VKKRPVKTRVPEAPAPASGPAKVVNRQGEVVDLPMVSDARPIPAPPQGGIALPAGSQWPKGVSGNPGGMPRGKKVSTRVMEMLTWPRADLLALMADDQAEVRDHLAARSILRAMKPDDANADMNTMYDRTEGKVAQDFNVRAAPTLTPEQVAEQVKNAGLIPGGPGADEF